MNTPPEYLEYSDYSTEYSAWILWLLHWILCFFYFQDFCYIFSAYFFVEMIFVNFWKIFIFWPNWILRLNTLNTRTEHFPWILRGTLPLSYTHSKANKLAHVWCTMPHKCFWIILEAITCTSPLAMQAYQATRINVARTCALMLPLYWSISSYVYILLVLFIRSRHMYYINSIMVNIYSKF